MLLHCEHAAQAGGETEIIDHELLYIHLRDLNPDHVRALSHPEVMTIPANIVDGREIRPVCTGPVFLLRPDGRLHMRYTDRTRSIQWRDDDGTRAAVAALKEWLHSSSTPRIRVRLAADEGLVCHNVLHSRDSFIDGSRPRILYRIRALDAVKEED